MTKQSNPEFRLICAGATTRSTDADRESLHGALAAPLDEALLVRLVDRHRVAPLLLRGLAAVDFAGVSERFHRALKVRAQVNSARALRQTAELVTLGRAFERERIEILPMKGVVLAAHVYGDLSLRVVGDIDLLVDSSRALEAAELLASWGYLRTGPHQPLTPRQTEAFMRERKHFHYVHPDSDTHVELHWRCVNNPRLFPVETDEMLRRAGSLEIGGTRFPTMAAEDLMLFLCVHGANHGWFRLIWLCDVHELLTRETVELDMDDLRRRALEVGLDRVLLQACLLSHEILETPVPDSLLQEARGDPAVMDLVEVARRALIDDESRWWVSAPWRDLWRQTRYRLKLRPNPGYKLRGLRTLMFSSEDWDAVSLPDSAFPVYLLLRPVLAIKRRLWNGSEPGAGAAKG